MKWSNYFSYGEDNYILFAQDAVTQIVGVNGSGKSSIPLILEETLYGKNRKNVRKAMLKNRNLPANASVSSSVRFSKDNIVYKVDVVRNGDKVKVTLWKGDEDISHHTAKNTYAEIESILGLSYSTFSQLVYQSSKDSLDFLTATDTQRKAFLTTLLNLEEYNELYQVFKTLHKETSDEVNKIQGSINTITKWLDRDVTGEPVDLVEVPLELTGTNIESMTAELKNINAINKKRADNSQYKHMRDTFVMPEHPGIKPDVPQLDKLRDDNTKLHKELIEKQTKLGLISKQIEKIEKLGDQCPTCYQHIDSVNKEAILTKLSTKSTNFLESINNINCNMKNITNNINTITNYNNKLNSYNQSISKLEDIIKSIDESLDDNMLDETELKNKIVETKRLINDNMDAIRAATEHNNRARVINAGIQSEQNKMLQYKQDLELESKKMEEISHSLSLLDILRKVYSPTGIIGYKIKSKVNELEDAINGYLSDFSDGRFQLSFELKGDKLNISLLDNSDSIEVGSLSSGELSRVNASVLLSIRLLMSDISNTDINLLFLDEIMGVLDDFGKERLVEILLQEKNLNTFIVSHEYTHPLLNRIQIIKSELESKIVA